MSTGDEAPGTSADSRVPAHAASLPKAVGSRREHRPYPDATSVVQVRVRFVETDAMGVVHHSSYVPYLELARIEYLRRRGVSYAQLTATGVHLPVVELSVRYLRPARFDDLLEIELWIAEHTGASVRFDYRVARVDEGASELARASVKLACIGGGGAELKPRRLPPELAAVFLGPEVHELV